MAQHDGVQGGRSGGPSLRGTETQGFSDREVPVTLYEDEGIVVENLP